MGFITTHSLIFSGKKPYDNATERRLPTILSATIPPWISSRIPPRISARVPPWIPSRIQWILLENKPVIL